MGKTSNVKRVDEIRPPMTTVASGRWISEPGALEIAIGTNPSSGTLSGTFQPPNVSGTVPSGVSAMFYIQMQDSLGNVSNVVNVLVRF